MFSIHQCETSRQVGPCRFSEFFFIYIICILSRAYMRKEFYCFTFNSRALCGTVYYAKPGDVKTINVPQEGLLVRPSVGLLLFVPLVSHFGISRKLPEITLPCPIKWVSLKRIQIPQRFLGNISPRREECFPSLFVIAIWDRQFCRPCSVLHMI